MPRATYMLEFELAYNTYTDLSADWHTRTPLVIERGITPGERIAGVGQMQFALYNPDGRYTPGHASMKSGFDVGIGVRLRASDGANTYTLFYGRLAEIMPREAEGQPVASLTVLDEMADLRRVQLGAFPLLYDATPQELVRGLVGRGFVPPGALGYWRVGHADAGALGQDSTLSGDDTGVDYAAGQSVFPWAGDTWPAELRLSVALADVCASESGYFYLGADGTPVFADRHTRPTQVDADATLSMKLAALGAEHAARHVANRIEITVYPRGVADNSAVLWEAGHALRVIPGEPREMLCRYRDPDQEAIEVGAVSLESPVYGQDFTLGTHVDPDHADNEVLSVEKISIRVEDGGNAARVTLTNNHTDPIYVHDLQLWGVPVRTFQPVTLVVEDESSRLTYGARTMQIDMPLEDDANVGHDLATALLANHVQPHPWLQIAFDAGTDAALLTQALARDVGDRVHVSDSELALAGAAGFIDGIRHELQRGGARHRVTWFTSPADLYAYWLLGESGYSALGESALLGY